MSEPPVVVKLGSAMVSGANGLNREGIAAWGAQIATAMASGERVVVVSSGAVAAGVVRLGMDKRPTNMNLLQATAAVGQLEVANGYGAAFEAHGLTTAIVLLTHADIENRERYLNARGTLMSLLDMGVVPVINENDSVATDEIRFGDNDTLAAMVASLLGARLLVLLTDQEGLHERDPRSDAAAPLVQQAPANDPRLDAMAGGAGATGQGGMASKVRAARLAARSGCDTIIAPGKRATVILDLLQGAAIGTRLSADIAPLDARKRWIADQLRPRGELLLDAGAAQAVIERGVSLLPVGVREVTGEFRRGDLVACVNEAGTVVAQGLANYDSGACRTLKGAAGSEIFDRLGFNAGPELIHRDNLVVVHGAVP